MQTISFLETAIVSITLALIFYTIGTWAERLQKTLKIWHVVFFLLGLTADTLGTSIMSRIVNESGGEEVLHAITGLLALILMAVHAIWAIWTYWRGSEKAKQNFSKFSVFVWAFWLIPYIIGAYLGSSH
ncbi:HsmA family protein [Butyricimonas faecalis]|uniref:TIGR03987 family protein n=1 Tax=Butyricimonas faecalis TaxID=2093856 RepID=A0A3Q9IUH8_9BACT|nr:HsmA family protein [Butyricimonas faecalis]AZS31098.1 TIGR03987 family protein [Butyricimonas faecalis]